MKKNYLLKKDVKSIRSSSHGMGPASVTMKNGSTYITKRSSKGVYVTVKGKRKYIAMGVTY